jgi:predicted trehalose synthase
MNKLFKLIGIAAIVAVIGLSMTTCSSDTAGDTSIVGMWYSSQANANAGVMWAMRYNFKANGELERPNSTNCTYTAVGNKLTMYLSGVQVGTGATYRISGTLLSITNAGNSGFANGTYYKSAK